MNTKFLKMTFAAVFVSVCLLSASAQANSNSQQNQDTPTFIDAKYLDSFYKSNDDELSQNIQYKLSSTEDVQTLIDSTRKKISETINDLRAVLKQPKFTIDTKVQIISQRHAKWMSKNFRNSQNQYNQNPGQRLEAEGIRWWAIEEYIDIYQLNDGFDAFLLRENLANYFYNYINKIIMDPMLTHFGIGLYPTEDMGELYVCIDFYTPYKDQPERKRPYAELLPNTIGFYSDEKLSEYNFFFTFKNTGNTNLTNIKIDINLTNADNKKDILTTYEYYFNHILLPGQTITLSYNCPIWNTDDKKYIHIYTFKGFEITDEQPPKHYFTKPFTITNDGTDVSVDGAIANISDSAKLFGGYATFFVSDGRGSRYAIGQSKTVDNIELGISESKELSFTPERIDQEKVKYVRFVEITYWMKDK